MIDLHTHILWDMDDGAKTLEESLSMVQALEKNGVDTIVLTPHHRPRRGYTFDEQKARKQQAILQDALKQHNSAITLSLGCEIDASRDIFANLNAGISLNETEYVLIDFGMERVDIEETVYALSLKGVKVVVAHAERYHKVTLATWHNVKALGAMIQINAAHVIRQGSPKSRKIARALLKEDLVDIIASDMHDTKHAQFMRKAYKRIHAKYGVKRAQSYFETNPAKVLGVER